MFTIFVAGCGLRCSFCSDAAQVGPPPAGPFIESAAVLQTLQRLKPSRLQFVGGNPDENLPGILEWLATLNFETTVVWNSHMWMSERALRWLLTVVDVFVADLKFGQDSCARAVAGITRYSDVVKRNLLAVDRWCGEVHGRQIVRHLLLPGHGDCCARPVIDWLNTSLPHSKFNLMTGFYPFGSQDGLGRVVDAEGVNDWRRELAAHSRWMIDGEVDLVPEPLF